MTEPIRIGVLGAARIVPMALLRPSLREPPVVQVTAVAARSEARARKFAKRHKIPRVLEGYDALLAAPDIDAIYNPLPNSLHAEWSIRALKAGKHVLCEKPLASNAAEAATMARAADESGRILMEAFHWRYHPLTARIKELVDGGHIGTVQHVEAHMCIPVLEKSNIRFRYDLAGGATMDVGCYAITFLRHFMPEEPEVTSATAKLASENVDRFMEAEFRYASGATGRITCSLLSWHLFKMRGRIVGSEGSIDVFNPFLPQWFHRLTLRSRDGVRKEKVRGHSTYAHQIDAFAQAIRSGNPPLTNPEEAIKTMCIIDSVYEHAGLSPRG